MNHTINRIQSIPYIKQFRKWAFKRKLRKAAKGPNYRVYNNCDELPLDRFIKCICENNFKELIIEGSPPALILSQAWVDIYFEYFDLAGSNTGKYRMQLIKEITLLKIRLTKLEALLFCLSGIFRLDLQEELINIGFDVTLDPSNQPEYQSTLSNIQTRSREWAIDIKLKEAELQVLNDQEKGENQAVDKSYFTNLLARIATYKHVAVIHAKDITVSEFCSMVTEYLQFLNTMKPKNHERV